MKSQVANAEASEARAEAVDARRDAQNEAADAVRARAAAEDQINQLEAGLSAAAHRAHLDPRPAAVHRDPARHRDAVAGLTIDDIPGRCRPAD